MLPALRHARIIELLRRDQALSLRQMSDALGVSISTLRRDVDALCERGHLERTHGGAINPTSLRAGPELHHDIASGVEGPAKAAIGRRAAGLIRPGQTVILDSGSTTAAIARAARDAGTPFTAITNDLAIATLLSASPSIRLLVTGGEIRPGTSTLLGADALQYLQRLRADLAFIGAHAISSTEMSDTSPELAAVKKVILSAADVTVLVVDSSKVFSRAFCSFGGLRLIDRLVTDDRIDPDRLVALRHCVARVDLAPVSA